MDDSCGELQNTSRRQLLKSALIGSAAIGGSLTPAAQVLAQSKQDVETPVAAYIFFTPAEATFIEALVDHMVPSDPLTPSGSDMGINIFIDRALAGSWGKGSRMYMQGPWQEGTPSQGYQSPLMPSQLYRAGIASTNQLCIKQYGKSFELLDPSQKDELLKALESGKIVFEGGLQSKAFFEIVYQSVVEGLFADPIYGGNANKAAWKMIGFPGVIETNTRNIVEYKNKLYKAKVFSIADVS